MVFEIDRSLSDLERWWKGLESSEHELNPEVSQSSKVNEEPTLLVHCLY